VKRRGRLPILVAARRLNRLSRLPIRFRLTGVFVLAMAVLLAGFGVIIHMGLRSALDESVNSSLQTRADLLIPLVEETDPHLLPMGGSGLAEEGESLAQVLDRNGRVLDATPQTGGLPLLTPAESAQASQGTLLVQHDAVPGLEGRYRFLATPVHSGENELVVVVGSSLDTRDEALSLLLIGLLIGCPAALVLASFLAYLLASSALRPVEAMRREAEAISAAEPGRRLPVPPTGDEVARLGATLNAMLARLENAFTRERDFVSDASHELRTPLTLLKAELDLALSRPRPPAELENALRSAAVESDRLSQLAEDLLLLARADEGRLSVPGVPLEVRDILISVRERFARRASEAGRLLKVAAPAGLKICADRTRLEQALSNLLENALRHGQGPIQLATIFDDEHLELHVLDRGSGFREDFLPRAFERFSRSDSSRAGGGTGLGLAIVRIIAEAHGGSAYAANREGGGADVWLSLPRRRP